MRFAALSRDRAAHGGDMALFEYAAQADGVRHPETGFDRVGAILDVDSSSYEEPSETFKASIREVVKHMCKLDRQILLVLDLDRLARCLTTVSSAAP